MMERTHGPTRRHLLGGGLVVAFGIPLRARAQIAGGGEGGSGPTIVAPEEKADLRMFPMLDAWIRLDGAGLATVLTGKVELGQGIRTALTQVAAEELDMPPTRVTLVTADTARTPDEGLTAGSHSMQDSGTSIQNAAANVRTLLIATAAERWGAPTEAVFSSGQGTIRHADGRELGYGELAASLSLHVKAKPNVPLRAPATYRTLGRAMPRLDIPAKLTGGEAFIQDMRLPGMLHARVLRGPSIGSRFAAIDTAQLRAMPGVVAVVQAGGFYAVVAETEWQAITALRRAEGTGLVPVTPEPAGDVVEILKALPAEEIVVLDLAQAPVTGIRHRMRGRYTRPWLGHGSIGPSCALAQFRDGRLTIWTHSQGTFDVLRVASDLLHLPLEAVHAIHVPGSGCYGQNGADDVSAEAAFIAHAVPGRPIRLQWMREQEFGWEPLGPAMVTELEAALDSANQIVVWRHEVWSNPHNNRPVNAGGVLIGTEIVPPLPLPKGKPIPMPEGDGDRNANPLYDLKNVQVLYHFLKDMPVRVSALRSLGAHLNVFSIESMFDELAKAGGLDPLALRLAHMADERARAVMQAAADRFGWSSRREGDGRHGCGMGFARYKNLGAYCAVMLEVEVEPETGVIAVRRVVGVVDSGQPANPDGIRNQVEGGIVQSLSWAMQERTLFGKSGRCSFDWSRYPILRFRDVPDSVDVLVMDRPGLPFLGTAECAQGPASAALANALADATGLRLRDMPLDPAAVKAGLETLSG
jgi:nicotinate dehydrogenase subunit B